MKARVLNNQWMIDAETRTRLVQAADRVAIRPAEEAAGKCFLSTMEFIFTYAVANSIELQVAKWKVFDDLDFCEHWAIVISKEEVIDLTRAQVDGNTNVLHRIDSYPYNYCQMKLYPASIVMRECQFAGGSLNAMSAMVSIKTRWAMFRFDLANAPHYRKPAALAKGIPDILKFVWWVFSSGLVRRLESRQDLAVGRLNNF